MALRALLLFFVARAAAEVPVEEKAVGKPWPEPRPGLKVSRSSLGYPSWCSTVPLASLQYVPACRGFAGTEIRPAVGLPCLDWCRWVPVNSWLVTPDCRGCSHPAAVPVGTPASPLGCAHHCRWVPINSWQYTPECRQCSAETIGNTGGTGSGTAPIGRVCANWCGWVPTNSWQYTPECRGGPSAHGGPWLPDAGGPWGEHSWGISGWPGEHGYPPFASYPAYEQTSEQGPHPSDAMPSTAAAAASASSSTGRMPTPSTTSPGRPEHRPPDHPQGDGAEDPWLEAARGLVSAAVRPSGLGAATMATFAPESQHAPQPPDLPQPAMYGWNGPSGATPPPSGAMPATSPPTGCPPRTLTTPWPMLQPPTWGGQPLLPWAQPGASTGPPGVWKGDFADPPAWPGWQYRRQWVTAVRRWNKVTDIPLGRRAERILRTLGWEMMSDFEHLSEAQLAGPDYLEAILKIIEMKAGVREDDDRRAAFRGVLHENAKRKDETLGQYANRRLRDFAKASSYGVQLPEEFRAALLREGAGLSEQGQQNLTTLLQGYDHDVDRMALTLSRMDGRPDRLSGFTCEAPGPESYLADPEEEPVDGDEGDTAGEGSDSTDDQAILEELSDMNFSSEQASLVFALLENRPPRLRRTWKENKKFKAELRKDRQSFTKGAPGEGRSELSRGPPRGSNTRPKVSREQLKKISRCHLCGRRGHWAEDCRQAQSSGKTGNGEAPGRPSGFCYLGTSARGGSHFSFMTYVTPASTSTAASTWSFLTIPSGMAILDIGATQDIVGKTAFRALEHELDRCGLKALEIPTTAPAPTGIGGAAQVSKTALVPISPGGVPGVIQFLVIDGEVPPLLSVGLLEHLGANMDLTTNEVRLKNIDVNLKMVSLPSGHRAIQLVEWTGGDFPVPQMARDQYGLSEGAFSKDAKSSSAYIKQEQCDRAGDWEQQPTALNLVMPPMIIKRFLQSKALSTHVSPWTQAQLTQWATALPGVELNSISQPSVLNMEDPSRPMEAAAGQARDPVAWKWRHLILRMYYLLETIRANYARLASAETHQKSILSERKKFLTADAQEPMKCLHPGAPIRRANQYASWTVCRKCEARLSYVPHPGHPRGKAKARSTRAPASSSDNPPAPSSTGYPSTTTPSSRRAREGPPHETIPEELNATLQAMASSFREVGESLRDLARGQGQMLMMMQQQSMPVGIDEMTLQQVSEAAARNIDQEMTAENETPQSWSHVSNPNLSDLP
eukprot:s2656_g4.t1